MPGVPPNAVDLLKRTFKGIFKRGKKSKQDQEQPVTSAATTQQSSNTPAQAAPVTESAAPQLPPMQQNDKPLQSQIDESKPLPPTHPLSRGQHEQPQEAVPRKDDAQPGPPPVPQEHDAQPGPPPGTAITASTDGAGELKEPQRNTTAVSSLEASPERAEGRKSEVSAIENNDPLAPQSQSQQSTGDEDVGIALSNNDPLAPLPPSKNDSGIEEPKVETAKENIQPNGITSEPTTASPNDTTGPTNDTLARTTSDEEKVAVMHEEPPPIKDVRAAPGMSATSGPLEDYPEGSNARY